MANEPQSVDLPPLSATVERCLTRLQSLSLALDTYGNEDHAVLLHEVIAQLQKAVPAQPASGAGLNGACRDAHSKSVGRQVANTLRAPLAAKLPRFRVADLPSRQRSDFARLST